MRKRFYPHQREMFRYSMTEPHPILFVEMRLGKTLVVLRRCALYRPINPDLGVRVLVVAPGSALTSWISDAGEEKYQIFPLIGAKARRIRELDAVFLPEKRAERRVESILTGPDGEMWGKRGLNAPKRPGIALINIEGWRAIPEIAGMPWDAVIMDESQGIKNPTSKVTKFFLKHFRDCPHRWILTGTPCPEGEEGYFTQIAFCRGGAFGFRTFWDFRMHYMRPHPAGFGWVLKPGAADHLRRVVGGCACVIRRKDLKIGPAKVYEVRTLELPKEVRRTYDTAERSFILERPGYETISTKWSPSLWNWLRRLCGGFFGDDPEPWWLGKMEELKSLLTGELARDQVVVWCYYNNEVHHIQAMLRKKKIVTGAWTGETPPPEREKIRKDFMSGKSRVLVLQQATAQTGMDLSCADTAIYFSTPVSLTDRLQTEDRILSIKKKSPLLYIDLVVRESVDEDVRAILDTKEKLSTLSLNRALQAHMRKRTQNAK